VKQGLVAPALQPLAWAAPHPAPPAARAVCDGSELYFSKRDRGSGLDLHYAWTRGATVPLYLNGTDSGETGIGYAVPGP
jgi:hypothetical protein